MDVADREQLLHASRDPRVPRRGQTLRAMPIAAAVGEGRLRALVTAIAVPAERGGATLRDRPKDAPMLPADPGPSLLRVFHEALRSSGSGVPRRSVRRFIECCPLLRGGPAREALH